MGQLDRQIGSQFYERTALSKDKAAMLVKGSVAKPEDAVTAPSIILRCLIFSLISHSVQPRHEPI